MQFRSPFAIEDQHANNRRKRQDGVQRRSVGGDLVDVEHFVGNVLFFIQVALPEEVGDRHADDSGDGDRQRGLKGKVDQRHFGRFGRQHDVARGGRKDNRRRRGADGRRRPAADTDVYHHREQGRHQQHAEAGRGGDGQ